MKLIIYYIVTIVLINTQSITITQNYLDNLLIECYESSNNPIDGISYSCDFECQEQVQKLLEKIEKVNDNIKPIEPCDKWFKYKNNKLEKTVYDSSNIENGIFELYVDCLNQIYQISTFNDQVNKVYQCAQKKAQDQSILQEDSTIVRIEQVNNCKNECETVIQCKYSCKNNIDTNFDNTRQICIDAADQQSVDFENGITQNQEDFSEQSSKYYVNCLQENIQYNTEYDINSIYINWDLLGNQNQEDVISKYSVYKSLQTQKEKMKVTLDCYQHCYDYNIYLKDLFVYEKESYDNTWVLNYLGDSDRIISYGTHESIDIFWDDADYQSLNCYGDDCIDYDNNFIGQFDGLNTNPCQNSYCFVELFGCIERCQEINCPDNECFQKDKGQSLSQQIETFCQDFLKIQNQFIEKDEFHLYDYATKTYRSPLLECTRDLIKVAKNEYVEYEIQQKQIIDLFTCIYQCANHFQILEGGNNYYTHDVQVQNINNKLSYIFSFLLIIFV